jgi:Fic family protein
MDPTKGSAVTFRNGRRSERIVVPELVDCLWEGGGYGARKDRKPFRFKAYVPDPIAEWDNPLAGRAADAVAQATAFVVQLQAADIGQDLEAIAGPLLRAEAVGSSFIEGLRASNKRVALAAYEPLAADGTARAVANNVTAMERAISHGTKGADFDVDGLLDIHRVLLEGTSETRFAGVIRTDQNWIGGRGASPADAAFVPPPPDRVPGLLDDLVQFVNRYDLPAVAQAAIGHAQFETIHPFGDGNGRTGRCLIHVILRRRALTPLFVPPVSVVLAASARSYVAGLTDFREGRVDDWIGAFADALSASAGAARSLSEHIDVLLAEMIQRAGNPRADSVARRIITGLPAQPIVSAEIAADRYHVTPTAARAALNRLQEQAVLVPTRVGRRRGREWISDELFQLLDAFEYDIARTGDGRTHRAPSATRPPRNTAVPKPE